MEVNFSIEYHYAVVEEDIPKLSSAMRDRVKRAVEEKLMTHPELFGRPLRRSIKGYRKLRVGDYRVIFKIVDPMVRILIIQHRSMVYTIGEYDRGGQIPRPHAQLVLLGGRAGFTRASRAAGSARGRPREARREAEARPPAAWEDEGRPSARIGGIGSPSSLTLADVSQGHPLFYTP